MYALQAQVYSTFGKFKFSVPVDALESLIATSKETE